MKKILFAIMAIAIIAPGCKKCYQCTNTSGSEEVCKGNPKYDIIKSGQTLTDYQGQDYTCTVK